MKENKESRLGRWLGGLILTTGVVCMSAIFVAITMKLVSWILF